MRFNLGLFIFAIILIIGGVAFVYWKLLDDPVKRFHKFAIADANEVRNHTIPNETYYIAAYGASTEGGKTTTYLLDDYILNPTSLEPGKLYYIGRITGSTKGGSIIEKVKYRLQNKDLLFGVARSHPSSLGHNHIVLERETRGMRDSLKIYTAHKNGLFFVNYYPKLEETCRASIDRELSEVDLSNLQRIQDSQVLMIPDPTFDFDAFILRAGNGTNIAFFKFVRINSSTPDKVMKETVNAYFAAHAASAGNGSTKRRSPRGTVPNNDFSDDAGSGRESEETVFRPDHRVIRR